MSTSETRICPMLRACVKDIGASLASPVHCCQFSRRRLSSLELTPAHVKTHYGSGKLLGVVMVSVLLGNNVRAHHVRAVKGGAVDGDRIRVPRFGERPANV